MKANDQKIQMQRETDDELKDMPSTRKTSWPVADPGQWLIELSHSYTVAYYISRLSLTGLDQDLIPWPSMCLLSSLVCTSSDQV